MPNIWWHGAFKPTFDIHCPYISLSCTEHSKGSTAFLKCYLFIWPSQAIILVERYISLLIISFCHIIGGIATLLHGYMLHKIYLCPFISEIRFTRVTALSFPVVLFVFSGFFKPGARFNTKHSLPARGTSIVRLIRSWDRLTSIVGVLTMVRWYLYIKASPGKSLWFWIRYILGELAKYCGC